MKRIIAMVAAVTVLLTGCGQVSETETSNSTVNLQTSIHDNKTVSEIRIHEVGGEDGRNNNLIISQIDGRNTMVLTDRMKDTYTYDISDEDFQALTHIDFSDYIGIKDDTENIIDAVYYNIEIIYDDGSTDKVEVYIPALWNKLYEIIDAYEPVAEKVFEAHDSNNNTSSTETGTIGEEKTYYKEVDKEDIVLDEENVVIYARNQLLISVFAETEKTEVEKIVDEINAEIIGYIELTGDYQIEFLENKSLKELENIADYINSYPFVTNVTLNFINDEIPDDNEIIDIYSIEEGYIAVFQGGVGELVHKTFVYQTDDGFRYVNAESTTVSYGSPQWETIITAQGTAASKEEIIEIAKENDAGQFAKFPYDKTTYNLNDFLNMDW